MTYEGLRLKVSKYWRKGLANERQKKLLGKDFTIISNNCWGGMIYESYNLPKSSPTVGLFFFADDYICFLKNLKAFVVAPLKFISPKDSKWKERPEVANDKRFGHYPIGQLSTEGGTIEIFFLHYHSEAEAQEKWDRRCKRINWNRLLVKFNDQNGATQENIDEFLLMPYEKLFFSCKKWKRMTSDCVVISQPSCYTTITASHEPFGRSRYIDITQKINGLYKKEC